MSIRQFLTKNQLENAPDGEEGFLELVNTAQDKLDESIEPLERRGMRDDISALQTKFNRVVLHLGQAYGVEPFASMPISTGNIGTQEYEQFQEQLDDSITQLILKVAVGQRRDSMALTPDLKSTIRTHLHHVRDLIDRANLDEGRKMKLHAKLAAFEAALEKERINIIAVGGFIMGIMSLSANALTVADSATLQKLLSNTMQTVADAKAKDDENRPLPLSHIPVALIPQRQETVEEQPEQDDETPF